MTSCKRMIHMTIKVLLKCHNKKYFIFIWLQFHLNELLLIFICAFLMTLLVELPFGNIKKIIFDKTTHGKINTTKSDKEEWANTDLRYYIIYYIKINGFVKFDIIKINKFIKNFKFFFCLSHSMIFCLTCSLNKC